MLRAAALLVLAATVLSALVHAHWRAYRAEQRSTQQAEVIENLQRERASRPVLVEERTDSEPELADEVTGHQQVHSNRPTHSGTVQSTDPEANRHVISLGKRDGVEPGWQYLVSRGPEYVSTVEVTRVDGTSSVAREVRGLSKMGIRKGDQVMNGD